MPHTSIKTYTQKATCLKGGSYGKSGSNHRSGSRRRQGVGSGKKSERESRKASGKQSGKASGKASGRGYWDGFKKWASENGINVGLLTAAGIATLFGVYCQLKNSSSEASASPITTLTRN